jgi:hypothetical protein
MRASLPKPGLSKPDRIAIWAFLRTRQVSGTLNWSGLLGRNDSPRQPAAELRRAINAGIARFLRKVHFDTLTGCWEWKGAADSKGYSRFVLYDRYGGRKYMSGHRLAYHYFRGAIPEGLCLDHLCGFRDCVNPFHLEAVTIRENSLRQARWARRKARRPRCIHGHKFPECYPWPKKNRTCIKCLEIRVAALQSQATQPGRKPRRR